MKLKQFDIELEESPRIALFFKEEMLCENSSEAMRYATFSGMSSSFRNGHLILYFEQRYLNNFEDITDFIEWCKKNISSHVAKIEIHAGRFTTLP